MNTLLLVLTIYFVAYFVYAFSISLYSYFLAKPTKVDSTIDYSEHSITVIIPCYNESVVIVNSIKNYLAQDYPNFKIIVVDDGSRDGTGKLVRDYFQLEGPGSISSRDNLTLIQKKNGGKAAAFNTALRYVDTRYVVTVDADTLLAKGALFKLVQPFIQNPKVTAVGCTTGVVNNSVVDTETNFSRFTFPKKLIHQIQAVEYIRAFMGQRIFMAKLNATLLISGACGIFTTQALKSIGGFNESSICEDFEMTLRLQRYSRDHKLGWIIAFIPETLAWTEVPSSLENLWKQRVRWYKGILVALMEHPGLFKWKYGWVAALATPTAWLFKVAQPLTQAFSVVILVLIMLSHSWLYALLVGIFVLVLYTIINAISILTAIKVGLEYDPGWSYIFSGLVELFFTQAFYPLVASKSVYDVNRKNLAWNKFSRTGYKIQELSKEIIK